MDRLRGGEWVGRWKDGESIVWWRDGEWVGRWRDVSSFVDSWAMGR